jgi:hypothetical protein
VKYPAKPDFCQRDWGMHSCVQPANHGGWHACICGAEEDPGKGYDNCLCTPDRIVHGCTIHDCCW